MKSTIYGEVCVASEVSQKVKLRWEKKYRHFDQTKCVEKSPNAKQGYAMKSVIDGWNPLSGWNLPMEDEIKSAKANFVAVRKYTISFYTIITACRVYHHAVACMRCLTQGDLSTTLEMTVLFLVVISTKWNAWRNPLRRSCTTACQVPTLSFRGFEKPEESPGKVPQRRSSAL